jgi:MerR family transcriptional regulator/heat shock protein HspR
MSFKNEFTKDKPLLTTSIVAEMLGITPDRLRMYDTEKLINTHRVTTGQVQKRLYSQNDVEWLACLRILLRTHKMSISSLKFLLQILYKNSNVELPNNEIGNTLKEMLKNPNFERVVEKF